jgi:hypothetical protein
MSLLPYCFSGRADDHAARMGRLLMNAENGVFSVIRAV